MSKKSAVAVPLTRFERYKQRHGTQVNKSEPEQCPFLQASHRFDELIPEALEFSSDKRSQKLCTKIEDVLEGQKLADAIAALFYTLDRGLLHWSEE